MALIQEIQSSRYTSQDVLAWNIPSGDIRFADRDHARSLFHREYTLEDPSLRMSKDFPVFQYPDALAAIGVGAGAALEVVGRKAKLQGLKNIGRFLMGTGGAYFLTSRALQAYEGYEIPSSISVSTETPTAAPYTAIELFTNVPPHTAVIETSTPTITPEPTVTPTPTQTPTLNVYERYNLFPTPTLLPNQTPGPDTGLYARYFVGKEQGQMVEGYTQGIQAGDDGAMRYVLSPDTLVFPDGWPQYGQTYGAWPIPSTDARMSIDVYCSNPCVMRLVDANKQTIIREFSSVTTRSEDSAKQYRVYTELPRIDGTDTWIVIEPSEPGSFEPLWHTSLAYGPLEEPEILLPHQTDPRSGIKYDKPIITGVSQPTFSDEEHLAHELEAHVVVGKPVGRAEQWWQDTSNTSDGWKQVQIPIDREALGIPYGDSVTTKIVAPMDLAPGWHDVKVLCDDHCDISFVTPYGAALGDVSYDLTAPKEGEYRDEFGYLHTQVFLGTGTQWIIIHHEDGYGGASVDIQVKP